MPDSRRFSIHGKASKNSIRSIWILSQNRGGYQIAGANRRRSFPFPHLGSGRGGMKMAKQSHNEIGAPASGIIANAVLAHLWVMTIVLNEGLMRTAALSLHSHLKVRYAFSPPRGSLQILDSVSRFGETLLLKAGPLPDANYPGRKSAAPFGFGLSSGKPDNRQRCGSCSTINDNAKTQASFSDCALAPFVYRHSSVMGNR